MPLTVAGVESVLIARAGPKMRLAGMDGTTKDGTNVSLRDPIRNAIQSMGVVTADPVTPVDGDLASFTGFACEKLFDYAQIQLLSNILGNLTAAYDQSVGEDKQYLSQLAAQIRADMAGIATKLSQPYGPFLPGSGVAPLTTGVVMPNDPLAWPLGRSGGFRWPYPSRPGEWPTKCPR